MVILSRIIFRASVVSFHHQCIAKKPVLTCIPLRSSFMRISACSTLQCRYSSHYSDTDDDQDYEIDGYFNDSTKSAVTRLGDHNVFILQPNIIGNAKVPLLSQSAVELQLAESVGLVDSVPDWNITGKLILSTSTPKDQGIFKGERLKKLSRCVSEHQETTAIFISMDRINLLQRKYLMKATKIDNIFDRYTLVLEIFRLRAKTRQAKLQVALAEIPYIRSNLKSEITSYNRQGGGARAVGPGEKASELLIRRFRSREQKLKKKLELLRKHRSLQREVRKRSQLPVVAVVGYTNAGKTTLIKALSKSDRLSPQDQLFATLDVTTHAAITHFNMKYLLVDTVGFLSNLPHSLIDAFSATMEDMLEADIILHVTDVSHPDHVNQKINVHKVLHDLKLPENLRRNMIEVCNKIDLLSTNSEEDQDYFETDSCHIATNIKSKFYCQPTDICSVSCTTGVGIEALDVLLHKRIVEVTGGQNIRVMVPASGDHLGWFEKHAAVASYYVEGDYHFVIDVAISDGMWNKFKARYNDYDVVDQ